MKVINKTNKKVLAKNATICKSWWSKVRGLIAKKPQTLVFTFSSEKRRGLHMVGVLFPIELLFLNKEKKVVEMATIYPFGHIKSQKKSQYIIETPQGTIKKTNTVVGDTIHWSK